MDDTKTSSPSIEPSHTADAPVLHWSLSVVLLSLACAAAAWVAAMGATWGKSHDDAGAMTFALMLLLGLDPFFMRRNHDFTPGGLVIVAGTGLAIAALSWLFRFNMIVFVWIGMTWALMSVARPTKRGEMIAHQIDLEKATRTSWINTKTEQSERMLVVYDFLTLLLVGFLLLAAWSAVAAEPPPSPRKPVATADELHDVVLDVIIDRNPRPPYLTSDQLLEQCRHYRGEERRERCRERADKVRQAEVAFPEALRKYERNAGALRHGFIVYFADDSLRNRFLSEQVMPEEKAFLKVLDQLFKNVLKSHGCMEKFDCRFVIRFDSASHKLHGMEFEKTLADSEPARSQRDCEKEISAACLHLGNLLYEGEIVPENKQKSAQLFEQACGLNNANGCFNLGILHREGEGTPQDKHKAAEYFDKACGLGSYRGCYNLGFIYFHGNELPKDEARAAHYLGRACDFGYELGCELMAELRK